ncbi:MAG: degP [Rickettsiales bacterium]|jgi:serine protease Do|nr:degP [Rickettsiales bacterium]
MRSLRFFIPAIFCVLLLSPTAPAYSWGRVPGPDGFADLVQKLMPSVVNISTTQKEHLGGRNVQQLPFPELPPGSPFDEFRDFFENMDPQGEPQNRETMSLGSGFIIDPDGYIATNSHVIADAEHITVTFADDSQADAKIIGIDSKTDLALLKVDLKRKLPAVEFGNSDESRVGDWVLAIGNPFGLGGTVTAGIISARARDINAGPFDDFLQTDAAINKGNSGGPMFNTAGKVIGINTAIFSPSGGSVGIGFAVPTSMAAPVFNQLKKHGRTFRAWLGVKIQTVTEDIADSIGLKESNGAMVLEVSPGSPAEKGGLKVGDVILEFDGKPIKAMRKLPRIVAETEIGKHVNVLIWRKDRRLNVNVALGELQEEKTNEASAKTEEDGGSGNIKGKKDLLGMSLAPLTRELKKRYNIADELKGVVVVSRDPEGMAAEKGIRAGDVIVSINQVPVTAMAEVEKLITQAKTEGRKSVLLLLRRGEDALFVALPFEAPKKKKVQ